MNSCCSSVAATAPTREPPSREKPNSRPSQHLLPPESHIFPPLSPSTYLQKADQISGRRCPMAMRLCIFGKNYSSFLVVLFKDFVVRRSVLVLIWVRLVECGADGLSARRSSGTSCRRHHSARAPAKKPFSSSLRVFSVFGQPVRTHNSRLLFLKEGA